MYLLPVSYFITQFLIVTSLFYFLHETEQLFVVFACMQFNIK